MAGATPPLPGPSEPRNGFVTSRRGAPTARLGQRARLHARLRAAAARQPRAVARSLPRLEGSKVGDKRALRAQSACDLSPVNEKLAAFARLGAAPTPSADPN
jgi:hypothetical protein